MTEDQIEQNVLETLRQIGWQVLNGPEIGPDGSGERDYHDTVLNDRLAGALIRLNPHIPQPALDEAFKKIVRISEPTLLENNQAFHKLLVDGVSVQYRSASGELKYDQVRIIDFDNPDNNEFIAINQLTILQGDYHRRPDVVLFVNGLPLVLMELKNAADSKADLAAAYRQIQTYKREVSDLFRFNELCITSDGIEAEMGTITSSLERMMPWKTIDGEKEVGRVPMLDVLARGVCDKSRLLDIIQNFIVFERDDKDDAKVIKKVAAYHQYWVVNKALRSTLKASAEDGNQRAGVVWHTQGSGKSLSMVFYTGKMMRDRELHNPTIVVVTDRNDLDGQLFGTFSACRDLLGEDPKQAGNRSELRQLLDRNSGGIIFTTIQKFSPDGEEDTLPVLTDRRNVIVMADEAHRSQYGLKARIRESDAHLVYGYAKYMRDALPGASYIGFTGTPIESDDKSTPAVFGDYVDIYDVKQAVEDGATVPIYYESRLVDLGMDESTKQWLDKEVDELLEGEEDSRQGQLKAEYAQKEAIVGNAERLNTIALDIIEHFEARQSALGGKGMIVTMSRAIAVELYEKVVAYRPEWHSDDDGEGNIKVIITGSASDPQHLQPHIRNKQRIKAIEKRIKNPDDKLELVIVCDMWLTGFDVPSMHTMYLDKPLKGHNLMQAIARVNRVWPGKTGGLVVDYLGVAGALRDAMADYTRSGGEGAPQLDIAEAVAQMRMRYEVVRDLFGQFDYKRYFSAPTNQQLQIILDAEDYILGIDDGEKRIRQHVLELSKAFALAMPQPEALEIREEVAFFQAIKARIEKVTARSNVISDEEYRTALKQIVDKAIAPIGVVDIFEAAGLAKPEISVLSDEFFAEIRNMERKNLAVEALRKLLNDEVKAKFSKNAVKDTKFSDMLNDALNRYKNGTVEAAQVIEELIAIGKEIRTAAKEGEVEGLTEDEVVFYDALVANGSAAEVMDDEQLREIAKLLVEQIRRDASIDWQFRTSVQAKLRINVKKTLAKYGYPPDQQAIATDLVLEQAKRYGNEWSQRDKYDGASLID
ncbi:MAG TPA: type I restriction endonuclease subunit R [Candidatus Saccharibacteria bacterium]|nr:type I restriction endonuclease subunit R [Candidatus Saccharibacteria bacterium]